MKKYWLFKGEPHVYGIDHLAAEPKKIGCWEGIRNYQARNFLRDQVSVNDEVFIYHSNCKHIGIVGLAKVVRAAYPDPAQFNPESLYYDPKSTQDSQSTNQKPRWVAVDIKLVKKFEKMISLAEIKAQPALKDMVLVKQSRLSTQPVTEAEWNFINNLIQ